MSSVDLLSNGPSWSKPSTVSHLREKGEYQTQTRADVWQVSRSWTLMKNTWAGCGFARKHWRQESRKRREMRGRWVCVRAKSCLFSMLGGLLGALWQNYEALFTLLFHTKELWQWSKPSLGPSQPTWGCDCLRGLHHIPTQSACEHI